MNLLILKFVHSRNVFPDDVELDVDDGSLLDGVEVGVVVGVGDDADLEGVGCGTANGKADTIDSHATLIDSEIAVLDHLLRALVFEGVLMAALLVLDADANGSLVNMALYDVSVQSPVHHHRAFHIHLVANLGQPQIAPFQRLSHGCHGVSPCLETNDSQANAVVGNALVDAELFYEWARQSEMHVVLLVFNGDDTRHTFNYSGKHNVIYDLISPTKVRISEHKTKGKRKFFPFLSSESTFKGCLKRAE